jgi:PIN domain nuclease of toxin-antitoxin system
LDNINVLDSSAILAVIFNEPGAEAVIDLLQGGLLSTVNLAEVHSRLVLAGSSSQLAWSRVLSLGCEVCLFDDEQARFTGELIASTRPLGLSLGDRACLALAIQRQAKVYTTNRAWKRLHMEIEIEVIR